ncbi:MAG: DUF3179 domain-containing protein [bacterium]|nr:DUF3179 domain-containing protein [bacterium]
MKLRTFAICTALTLALSPLARASGAEPTAVRETPPAGVEQILPRGGIPAVFEPDYVPAAQAEIPDDAWVLGVAIDGQARAYSLNLLNSHEIVNDRIGETNFAAVW